MRNLKTGAVVMGLSSGDGYQRIFKGKVTKIIPAEGTLPRAYVVDAEEIVTVADRYGPPAQVKGDVVVFEDSVREYREWHYEPAKACMVVMRQWKGIADHNWNPKNRDFFWKLYELAVWNLGLHHGERSLTTFESDLLAEKTKGVK